MCGPGQRALWFKARPDTDETVRERFLDDVNAALAGRLDHWKESPDGLVALVILLDQFTRNSFRNTPAAFSGDPQALALARLAITRHWHWELPIIYGVFLCMPFEHAEDLEAQEEGLALMDRLLDHCPPTARASVADFRRYLAAHRDVITRFGRFPHRNNILGRTSTPEELAYLETHRGF